MRERYCAARTRPRSDARNSRRAGRPHRAPPGSVHDRVRQSARGLALPAWRPSSPSCLGSRGGPCVADRRWSPCSGPRAPPRNGTLPWPRLRIRASSPRSWPCCGERADPGALTAEWRGRTFNRMSRMVRDTHPCSVSESTTRQNGLLALGSAAVLTVYTAGYLKTKAAADRFEAASRRRPPAPTPDRKSTRLNSSHSQQSRMPSSA